MIYVAAGTVHTIGGGMVLVETQQTSDITYRLYDYGRPRELHIEKGLAAKAEHQCRQGGAGRRRPVRRAGALSVLPGGEDALARSAAVEVSPDSPHMLVAVDGSGESGISGDGADQLRHRGRSRDPRQRERYTVRPQWDLDLMRMSLPSGWSQSHRPNCRNRSAPSSSLR